MMNPILASSALRRMRSMRTVMIFTIYGAFMLAFAILSSLSVLNQKTMTIGSMRQGIDYYVYAVALQFVMILLVAPGMTAGAISGERERQTLDLILVTHTGSFSIALGKLLESFGFVALVLFSGLPMLSVVLLFGGISLVQVLTVMLFMLVSALGALSVGLLASALFKRTAAATVVAYLAVFAIGILTLVPMVMRNQALTDMLANTANLGQVDTGMLFAAIPKTVLMNPGIGILSLVADQTGILERTFNALPNGYALYQVMKTDFSFIAWVNMGLTFALSLVFILLSALLIRPRSMRVRKTRKVQKELSA